MVVVVASIVKFLEANNWVYFSLIKIILCELSQTAHRGPQSGPQRHFQRSAIHFCISEKCPQKFFLKTRKNENSSKLREQPFAEEFLEMGVG